MPNYPSKQMKFVPRGGQPSFKFGLNAAVQCEGASKHFETFRRFDYGNVYALDVDRGRESKLRRLRTVVYAFSISFV